MTVSRRPPQERRVAMEAAASPGYTWHLDDALLLFKRDTATEGAAQVGCRVHETG